MQWKAFNNSIENNLAAFGWPDWNELQQKKLYFDQKLIDTILSRLAAHRFHLLIGPEGRGKSTLASLIAFWRFQTDSPVNVVFCPFPGEEPNHLAAAIAARNRTGPLWIFEDCHASTHPLSLLKDALLECGRTQFLFVFRAVSRTELPET